MPTASGLLTVSESCLLPCIAKHPGNCRSWPLGLSSSRKGILPMLLNQRKFCILQQQVQARAICQQSVKFPLCVRLRTELWMGLAGSNLISPSQVANDGCLPLHRCWVPLVTMWSPSITEVRFFFNVFLKKKQNKQKNVSRHALTSDYIWWTDLRESLEARQATCLCNAGPVGLCCQWVEG